MDRLAFNAVAAINEQRVARQMATNEMANATTVGFKRSFESSVRAIEVDGAGLKTRFQPQSFTEDFISMKAGPVIVTGNDLDVSLSAHSVMGVTAPDGTLAFTRRGDLRINAAGALETGNGNVVRSQSGGALTVPLGVKVTINSDGSVYGIDPAQVGTVAPVLIANILLRDASTTPLQRREDGLFAVAGAPKGEDITSGPIKPGLTSGALEGSNVNAMGVMVKMMDQARSFEMQVNMIKESKTCDESGATMMKSG
jgi:flagellar basal-body rod protein FlgF